MFVGQQGDCDLDGLGDDSWGRVDEGGRRLRAVVIRPHCRDGKYARADSQGRNNSYGIEGTESGYRSVVDEWTIHTTG